MAKRGAGTKRNTGRFTWSDGWLLQAIALASKDRPATLAEVIGAADAIQHSIPTESELSGALQRLTSAAYVEDTGGRFTPGEQVPSTVIRSIQRASLQEGGDIACTFLGAEPWSPNQPPDVAEYPGLFAERIRAAYEEYRSKRDAG